MTLKEIKKEAKKRNVVDTGFYMYIGFTEKWKKGVVKGFPCREYVSSLGRVYNPITEELRPINLRNLSSSPYGYLHTTVYYDDRTRDIHIGRLVLETFKGPPPPGMDHPQADHINQNPHDNSIDNLQWLSRSDNLRKANVFNNLVKYNEEVVHKICKMLEESKMTIKRIANENGVPLTFVYDIKYGRAWAHISSLYNVKNHKVLDVDYDPTIPEKMNMLINMNFSNSEIREILKLPNDKKTTDILSHHRKRLGKSLESHPRLPKELTSKITQMILDGKPNKEIYNTLNLPRTKQYENAIGQRRLILRRKGLI